MNDQQDPANFAAETTATYDGNVHLLLGSVNKIRPSVAEKGAPLTMSVLGAHLLNVSDLTRYQLAASVATGLTYLAGMMRTADEAVELLANALSEPIECDAPGDTVCAGCVAAAAVAALSGAGLVLLADEGECDLAGLSIGDAPMDIVDRPQD